MHLLRLLCAAAFLFVSAASAQTNETFRIGTGQRGGEYYAVGGAVCRVVNAGRPFGCTTVQTGGSLDNLYALSLRDADFAIVQADMLAAAWRGDASIFGDDYDRLRMVATVYPETLTVLTRADSDIADFSDLAGRRVAAGPRDSGSLWTMGVALDAGGVSPRYVMPQTFPRSAEALCRGDLDAVAMVTGHPSAVVARFAGMCPVRIVALDPRTTQALTRPGYAYDPATIAPDHYPFLDEPVPTVSVPATLVTVSGMPDGWVDEVLSAIFEDTDTFRRQHSVLDPSPCDGEAPGAPLHPAATRFYADAVPMR